MTVSLSGPVRRLRADDLGVGYAQTDPATHASSAPDAPMVDPTDPQVLRVIDLLRTYSGVILSGPPGTSKSYLAAEVAAVLSEGDDTRVAFTQFHASYQYEDFMEGYRPDEKTGGFVYRRGTFLELCANASRPENSALDFVIVIDELSRGDAARVFGESLTYVEKSKRGRPFSLPSGRSTQIPPNVHVIATMNPLDRGVDEVDAAFERRFAKVLMPPNRDLLQARLMENGVTEELQRSILQFFARLNSISTDVPAASLGHAYFWDVTDAASARSAWEYQVQHHVDRAFRYDLETRESMREAWSKVVESGADDMASNPALDAIAVEATSADFGTPANYAGPDGSTD